MARTALQRIDDHVSECSRRYEATEKAIDRMIQAVETASKAPGELEKKLMRWLLGIVGMIAMKVIFDLVVPHIGLVTK